MHELRWILGVIAIAAAACGAVHQSSEETGGTNATTAGSGGGGQGGQGGQAGRGGQGGMEPTDCNRVEPINHRASEEVCDTTRPPSMPGVDGGAASADAGAAPIPGACTADGQCTEGANGRCQNFRGDQHCTYDECTQDSDCDTSGPCGCERAFWSDANACLAGNCKTDADCGANGFCSPTLGDCGNYSGVVGYHCHTCEDECVNDSDCADGGDCRYSPEVAHWVCSQTHCVG